jgi:hypothetical protein
MNVILNLVRKDLRLLFWPWVGWVGLLLAKLALAAWVLTAAEFEAEQTTASLRFNVVLTGLSAVFGAVLVVWLVQADAPRRAQVFWRTRPVSWGQLLVAKGLTVFLLFGLAPVLVALPWWLFNGMGAADIAWSAGDIFVMHAAVIAPVFMIAALVDSVGRAVLWSFVQFGIVVCLRIFQGLSLERLGELERGLMESRVLLAVLLVALVMPGLIVWQYSRRGLLGPLVGFVAMQLAAVSLWLFSPYNFFQKSGGWTESNAELARGVGLQPAGPGQLYSAKYRGPGPKPLHVRSLWPITGVPTGLVADPDLMSLTITGANGDAILPSSDYAATMGFVRVFSLLGASTRLRDDFFPPSFSPDSPPVFIGFTLTQEEAARMKSGPHAVEVALRVYLRRTDVHFNQVPRPGEWLADEHGGLRIVRIEEAPLGARMVYANTQPRPLAGVIREYKRGKYGRLHYPDRRISADYLFHPDEGIVSDLNSVNYELRIFGVCLQRLAALGRPRPFKRDGKIVDFDGDMDKWRAGLRIARVVNHEQARFFLRGRTEAFVVEDDTRAK